MADEIIQVYKADVDNAVNGLRSIQAEQIKVIENEDDLSKAAIERNKQIEIEQDHLNDLINMRARASDPKQIQEYNKHIADANKRIGALKGVTDSYTDSQKEAATATKDTAKETSKLGEIGNKVLDGLDKLTFGLVGKMKGLFTTIRTVSQGFGVLKAAIAGTGIGLLVVALGSLVAYFTQTQRGADALSRALAPLKAIFKVLVDAASSVGETIVSAFSNPKQALIDFGNSVKEFVIDRFESFVKGLKGIGESVALLFKGEFTEAAKAAKGAYLDINRGINPLWIATEELAESTRGLVAEMQAEAKAAYELEAASQRLRDAQIALNVERAKSRAEIKELNLVAEDVSKSEKQRIEAATKALEIEQGLMQKRIQLAEENVRIITEQNNLGENTIEDVERLAEAEIELANIREESLELQTTINNKINAIRQQAATAEIARQKAIADAEKAAFDMALSLALQHYEERELALLNSLYNQTITQEDYNDQSLALEINRIDAIASLYPQESIEYKRLQTEKLRIQSEYNAQFITNTEETTEQAAESWKELDDIVAELEAQTLAETEAAEALKRQQQQETFDQSVALSQQLLQVSEQATQERLNQLAIERDAADAQHQRTIDLLYQELAVSEGNDRKRVRSQLNAAQQEYAIEQFSFERREALEKKRMKNVKRAQLIATTLAESVALARAYSDLGPIGGTIAAVGLIGKFAILLASIESQEYAKGTDYVEPLNSRQGKKVDDIPARLTKGEAVIPVSSNMANRGLVKSLVRGNVDDYIHRNYVLPAIKDRLINDSRSATSQEVKAILNDANLVGRLEMLTRSNERGQKKIVQVLKNTATRSARDVR